MKIIIALGFLTVATAFQIAEVYVFDPSGKSPAKGSVNFTQTNEGVHVQGVIEGLAPGEHGFHVHQIGKIAPACTAAGGHFNPHNKQHGAPGDENRHVGDLGNIKADANGIAYIDVFDKQISLIGTNCIVGRSVVVHEKADDLGKGGNPDSLVTGNAGGRVACGVIGVVQ